MQIRQYIPILSTTSCYYDCSPSSSPAPVYTPLSTPVVPPYEMITTSLITSALTATTFVSLSTAAPEDPTTIVEAIEGLSQCAQAIVFTGLADSTCNPSDFPCICQELNRLDISSHIAATCTADELTQYADFQTNTCSNTNRQPTYPPVVPSSTTPLPPPPPPSTPIPYANTTLPPPVVPSTPEADTTTAPFYNATSVVLIPTTDAQGYPSILTSQATGPAAVPSSTSSPEFTGGAASASFGTVRAVLMAGAIGLMGLVFAEL
ncbi:hypothetical protein BDV95DRAFT_612225 [Massariosphaeria phaeospora]|uniref:CFEM domain-containing protein n=1 Tax=Massariosphaeria phaeospora TaxID=100035 RepID=A0A7C8I5Z1_9PLEO|nr:hypothetical protein BDV95DRAFT_612225 [Massariosphaeria phaeospora]